MLSVPTADTYYCYYNENHMEVQYLKLIKIDHDNNCVVEENIEEQEIVCNYVMSIIEQISENSGDREYRFKSEEMTMRIYLDNLVHNINRDDQSIAIANRLLLKENQAQERYSRITEIQKGILLIGFCKMTEIEYKVVICKADYTEFIEEATGQKKNGLPTKKKIFKSFCGNVTMNGGVHTFGKLVTYDVNSNQSKYWYSDFLDLEVCLDDSENTKKAFSYINSKILDPLRSDHPHEHLRLWNMTVGYMRSEGEFSIDYYADNILGTYRPEDGLVMTPLVRKAKELPSKFGFDNRFNKVPSVIKSRVKQEYKLTDDIKLTLTNHIQNLGSTIKAYKDLEENKYIMIKSDEGYRIANSISNEGAD